MRVRRLLVVPAVAAALLATGCAAAEVPTSGPATVGEADRAAAAAPAKGTAAPRARASAAATSPAAAPAKRPAASARAVVLAAVRKTAAARTARFSLVTAITAGGATQQVRATGGYDAARGASYAKFTIPQTGGMEARQLRQLLYLRFTDVPGLSGNWLAIDLRKLPGGAALAQGNDPSAALEIGDGLLGVSAAGTGRVRGASATRYRATVDLAKAAASAPIAVRARLRQLLTASASPRIPAEFWVDRTGRVVRVVETVPMAGPRGAVSTSLTYDLYDFGAPVQVAAPPPSQLASPAETQQLLKAMAQAR